MQKHGGGIIIKWGGLDLRHNVGFFQTIDVLSHCRHLPLRGYADRDGIDSILHSCFDLLFAEAASLSLCYPICPVRKENKQSPTHRKLIFFVRNIPGYRVFLSPSSTLGFILPRIPVICRGNNHFFKDKHARTLICIVERQHSWFCCRSLWICWLGCNVHSEISCLLYTPTHDLLTIQVSSFPNDEPTLVLADAAAIKVKNFKSYSLQIYSYRNSNRKSQRQGLDFRSLHVNMKSFQSMVPVSWVVKVKNGKNIEKYPRLLSLMCVSMSDFLLWFFDLWF